MIDDVVHRDRRGGVAADEFKPAANEGRARGEHARRIAFNDLRLNPQDGRFAARDRLVAYKGEIGFAPAAY